MMGFREKELIEQLGEALNERDELRRALRWALMELVRAKKSEGFNSIAALAAVEIAWRKDSNRAMAIIARELTEDVNQKQEVEHE